MTIEGTNSSIPPASAAPSAPKTFTRVKVLESGPAKAKEVTVQKQTVRIKDSVSNKVQALSAVRHLEQQIEEAEMTLKAIQFTKKLIEYRSKSGQSPTTASIRKDLQQQNVPQNLQREIFKVYAFAAGTFGKPEEVKAETLKELAKTQFEYVQALRDAHGALSTKLPGMQPVTEESMAESTAFAKRYLSDPKNKFVGEDGILAHMEEGDRITLSRRQLSNLDQGTIPHSDFVAIPIGTQPKKGTQEKIKPLLVGTAFKIVPRQIMEKFTGGDGEGYIGFNINTNSSTKVPSSEVGLQLIDSMTHAFADLHANNIYQLDVKLQNTGVFETVVEGKKKVIMVLHDFGQAANLSHPTRERGSDETTSISVQGTPLYMSPEQAATGVEQQNELNALYRDLDDPAKDKEAMQRKISAFLQKTYSQMDCYSMALNAYTNMTGKLPSHLYEINQPRIVNEKEQAVTPFRILADVSEIKLDISPDNELGKKLREEFTADAKAHGYDKLIELVLQGFNTDASKRPSAADFQAYFAARKG